MTHVMLVGNPNTGKSTLFNVLTGEAQQVGHWPGVTVEKKTGSWSFSEKSFQLTDLPGVYALGMSNNLSCDAQITAQQVIWGDADIFVNVIDACHLERHLYLTSQLLELGKPLIVVLNMQDMARLQGIVIDTKKLSHQLGCPVIEMQANRAIGLERLQQAVLDAKPPQPYCLDLNSPILQCFDQMKQALSHMPQIPLEKVNFLAYRLLEEESVDGWLFPSELDIAHLCEVRANIYHDFPELDVSLADVRYTSVHNWVSVVQTKRTDMSEHLTAKIDRIVLNRFFALPIFFTLLYIVFFMAVQVGGVFQGFFDITTHAFFVQGSAWCLSMVQAPPWIFALISTGIGGGLSTTLTFIPVMAIMFLALAFLESSGYMSRAAFVMDNLMRRLGISGKALIPLIIGFGCNVPAVMATRTLEHEKERIVTVLMSPFMSCSARLSIYAVFVAAFFPNHGAFIVFSLYIMGMLMAVLTGYLLRHRLLKGASAPLIIELPHYHRPSLRFLFKEMSRRLKQFLIRAGRLIVPISILLSVCNAWFIEVSPEHSVSILSYLGQCLTPLFVPMGLQTDNWPAVVGLLTGMLAKEVVIGSLNNLYTSWQDIASIHPESLLSLWSTLQEALISIPKNFFNLFHFHLMSDSSLMSSSTQRAMVQHFGNQSAAYAYLLFVLLYIPCASTMAAIRQEIQAKYMWLSIGWSLFVAYASAVLFYQIASHGSISLWIGVALFFFWLVIWLMKKKRFLRAGGQYVVEAP